MFSEKFKFWGLLYEEVDTTGTKDIEHISVQKEDQCSPIVVYGGK